jgi:hypothetical protein
MMSFRVDVERLVLHGLAPVRQEEVAEELRRALGVRLAGGSTRRRDNEVARIDCGSLALPDDSPAALASGIANAVSRAVLP